MLETADFVIRQDDTAPRMIGDLVDGQGTPVDVTGATVHLHLHGLTVEGDMDLTAAVDEETPGRVYHDWVAGDTDVAGIYAGEWQVTYTNAQIETFPNAGWFLVEVREQLA